MGLKLTNCIDKIPTDENSMLYKEIELIEKSKIDDNLYNIFEEKYKEKSINGAFLCDPKFNDRYIINNSVKPEKEFSDQLQLLSFCPYTSILDGMSECSFKSTALRKRIEYGDINFKIRNKEESYFYNGFLKIRDDSDVYNNNNNNYKINVDLGFNIKFPDSKYNITGKKENIDVSKTNILKATVVLRDTLKTISYIPIPPSKTTYGTFEIKKTSYFWDYLESQFIKEETIDNPDGSNQKIMYHQLIFSKILFKGCGDLFQEINSVAKYGAYINNQNYYIDEGIYKYVHGESQRCFIANDTPSACRFMFMLLEGKKDEINTKAYGGYKYIGEEGFIIKRTENKNNCNNPKTSGGGKTKKNNKKAKNKKTKKIKKRINQRKTRKQQKIRNPRKTRKQR